MADFLTSIGDMLGLNKGKATSAAADQNGMLLSDLANTGTANLNQAKDLSLGQLGQVQKGATLYQDALGINGAGGNANASTAFTTQPGYEFSRDQGTDALMRTASARGDLGGGGTGIDIANFVTNGANQQWDKWLSNLGIFQQQLPGATSAATGSLGDLTSFAGDIASGRMGANNQNAAGGEAGQGSLWDLANNVASVAGSAFGLKKPGAPGTTASTMPGFGGYGSF